MEFLKVFENFIIIFKAHIHLINIVFLLIIIFSERKTPMHSLFWISLLIFAPYLGFFTFLFFGLSLKKSRFINKFHTKMRIQDSIRNFFVEGCYSQDWKNLVEYLAVSQAGNLSSYESSTFFSDGDKFFKSLKKDISDAKENIFMEFFIFKNDALGDEFFQLIMEKAKAGVKVKLLLDGTNYLSYFKVRKLRDAGIKLEFFFPLHPFSGLNLKVSHRNHRKITIIDGMIGYIGGFNIGNEYIGKGSLGKWRDTAIRVKGEIVHEFEKEFFISWNFVLNSHKKKPVNYSLKHLKIPMEKKYIAQLVSSGPNFQLRTARDNFLKMITGAQEYIYIETPYFIPDDTVLSALKIAATSGVKIKIIVPNVGDHPFVYWINQAFMGELLEYGIKFYRYTDGFVHSKFLMVDDRIATLGSANFDYRSFYENFEININIYSESEVIKLKKIFASDLKKSILVTNEEYGKRTIFIKTKESMFRLLSPML